MMKRQSRKARPSPIPNSSQVACFDMVQPTKIAMKNALVRMRLLTTKKSMIRKMVAGGDLGVKSGKGFYEWDDEGVAAVRQRVGKALAAIGQFPE